MCDEALKFPTNYKIYYKSKIIPELKREYFLVQPYMKGKMTLLDHIVILSFRANF